HWTVHHQSGGFPIMQRTVVSTLRSRRWLTLAVVPLVVVGMAACSSGGGKSAASSAATTAASSAAPSPVSTQPRVITDTLNRQVTVPAQVNRVAAIGTIPVMISYI